MYVCMWMFEYECVSEGRIGGGNIHGRRLRRMSVGKEKKRRRKQ